MNEKLQILKKYLKGVIKNFQEEFEIIEVIFEIGK
jgi:uncharacterized protein YnzC (UPF0291/DUF896 family)